MRTKLYKKLNIELLQLKTPEHKIHTKCWWSFLEEWFVKKFQLKSHKTILLFIHIWCPKIHAGSEFCDICVVKCHTYKKRQRDS